jgi:hypothetical protein
MSESVETPAPVETITVRIIKEQTHPTRFAGEVYCFPKPEADELIASGAAEVYTP